MPSNNTRNTITASGLTWGEIWDSADAVGKKCSGCGEYKPFPEFTNQKRGLNGKAPWCKTCDRNRRTQRSPEAQRAYYVVWAYGSSALPVEKRRLAGAGCDVCGDVLELKRMHLDHDHETNVVRGLLCDNCNRALGLLKDSAVRASALAAYRGRF